MKTIFFQALICFISAASTFGAESVTSPIEIVTPIDKSIIESEIVSIVLRNRDNAVDQVQISVNNGRRPLVAKLNGIYLCKDGIQLSYGINKINVVALKDGKKIGEITTQVFCLSDLSQNSSPIPLGFKKYSFHTDMYEKNCVPCHQLDLSQDKTRTASGEASPCYTCHKKILNKYLYVHGPAAVWTCQSCHDSKSESRKYAIDKPVGKICVGCHEYSWDGKKYQHGPTAAGDCTTCHSPHASNNKYFLRLSTFDLCVACHEEILRRPHIITSFQGNGGHPLKRFPDPYNPGREFNCASCHNPHGSNSSVLLNGYDSSMPMNSFCLKCHKM